MTCSQTIIVRESIFKNQNLSFASGLNNGCMLYLSAQKMSMKQQRITLKQFCGELCVIS